MKYRIISLGTGDELKPGDVVTDFRGDKATYVSFEPSRHSGSTGRINVKFKGGESIFAYFPSVYDCEIQKI